MDVHGTVDNSVHIPSYVKNHGIVKGTEVHALLRQSKVSVSCLKLSNLIDSYTNPKIKEDYKGYKQTPHQ